MKWLCRHCAAINPDHSQTCHVCHAEFVHQTNTLEIKPIVKQPVELHPKVHVVDISPEMLALIAINVVKKLKEENGTNE